MSQSSGHNRWRKVQLSGVGEVLLEKSKRAKRIHLTVRPFRGVRVAVPRNASYQEALEVAQANLGWITKQLKRIRHIEKLAIPLERPAFFNRAVARNLIVERVQTLAHKHGFTYKRVFVRNQKTRWGSCSQNNNINLNLHLVFLPDELRDYVILHELVHTRIKHHGPDFWRALEEEIPGARQLDGMLNRYEILPHRNQNSP